MKQLFLTRVRVFLREPEAVFWTFGFPLLIAVALGIAFRSKGPDKMYVAIENLPEIVDGPPESGHFIHEEEVERALRNGGEISVELLDEPTARNELRTGKVALIVVPGDKVTFRYDPTRPESRVARLAVEDALDRAAGRPQVYATDDEPVTEKGSRYIDFLIPGLIGMNIMSASMWGIGYSIVDQRGKKLLKRLAATPMPKSNYLWAFILGNVVLVAAMVTVVLVFARLVFGVQMFGSLIAYFAVALFGAMSFAGLGLAMASRTDSSEVLGGMNNAAMLPMFVGSGVFFSYEHFPKIVLPLIKALPLTALNDALRAISIDGASIVHVWPQLLVLAIWGAATFLIALRAFRWT